MRGIQYCLLAVLCGAAQLLAQQTRLAVLIELKDQPQRELHSQIEDRLRQRATQSTSAEDITLESRREAALAIRQQIQPSQETVAQLIESLGGRVTRSFQLVNVIAAEIPTASREQIAAHPAVAKIDPDQTSEIQIDLSVPAMEVRPVWDAGITGTGESVIVLDTGVNAAHPAFSGRVRNEIYLQGNTNCPAAELTSPNDFNGHGTHAAGIIASAGTAGLPNRLGVARGLGQIINAKIGCESGVILASDRLAAIEAALVATPAAIANNSSTAQTQEDDDVFARAIDSLIDRFNLIWVNAAGNTGPAAFSVGTPGTAYNGITVANLDLQGTSDRTRAVTNPTSSRGPTIGGRFKPDLAAPGTNITSTSNIGDGWVARTGTSMAAAHIAGAAALLRQAGVRDRLAMKALLINTTDNDGWLADEGWGFVNVGRAYNQRQNIAMGNVPVAEGSSVFYRVIVQPGQSYFATLVWSRYLRDGRSVLRNLDLEAYRAENGEATLRSVFTGQNVEQLAFRNSGSSAVSYIIRVEGRDAGASPEPFALASSLPLESFTPAALDVTCVLPEQASRGEALSISCTTRNTGGLPFFAIDLAATIDGRPAGTASVGALGAQASANVTVPITAPALPGPYPLRIVVTGLSFGEIHQRPLAWTLNVRPPEGGVIPIVASVVSAASFQPGFSSASWVTITGDSLSTTTREWTAGDFQNNLLPTELDGVRVTINGRAAYLAYISPTQLNVLAPDDPATGPVEVIVTNTLGRSPGFSATKQAVAPAFFMLAPENRRFIAATLPDGVLVGREGLLGSTPTRVPRQGDVIALYATGCGPTNPATPANRMVAAPAPMTRPRQVRFGDATATVRYAGVIASGLCQLNVVVPRVDPEEGPDYEVTLTIDGVTSPLGAHVPVQ